MEKDKEHIPGWNPISQCTIQRDVARALAKMSPMAPKLYPGKYGHRYDRYACAECGAGITEAHWNYCPNCGQRISDASLGRRKTDEEQAKYHQMNIFDLFKELQMQQEVNDG